MLNRWGLLKTTVRNANLVQPVGRVSSVVGLVVEVGGLRASVGDICTIDTGRHTRSVTAEVVGFRDEKLLLMPFEKVVGISEGSAAYHSGKPFNVPVGEGLLGRVIGALGEPLDGKGPVFTSGWRSLDALAPSPLDRLPIDKQLETGVKIVDAIVPCGLGQRMGIFSGSGVGKSVLLGMISRYARSDVNVVALIGERGREVREFVENVLGRDGLRRSVVVTVTSDRSPVMRVKGAESAMAIAEYFRDMGLNVLFIMDSITRYAMALREIGLAVGEPPTARGYTPSVFAKLPAILERAGNGSRGSITGLYSVLIEGDDISADPLTDAIRAILDGHVVLSRKLANMGLYPAVDILESVSRLAPELLDGRQSKRRDGILKWFADYREAEDLINIGAYESGSNPEVDKAIEMVGRLRGFFRQNIKDSSPLSYTEDCLGTIINGELDT